MAVVKTKVAAVSLREFIAILEGLSGTNSFAELGNSGTVIIAADGLAVGVVYGEWRNTQIQLVKRRGGVRFDLKKCPRLGRRKGI